MFHVNRFRPTLFSARGSGGGRRGHGLSRSLSGSEAMLSIFTLSVTPARLRLSVRTRFPLSAPRLSAAGIESRFLAKLLSDRAAAARMSRLTAPSLSLDQDQ